MYKKHFLNLFSNFGYAKFLFSRDQHKDIVKNKLSDEDRLVHRIIDLVRDYGNSYGRIMILLRYEGWRFNHKSMLPLWRLEGLKVSAKQQNVSVCVFMLVLV